MILLLNQGLKLWSSNKESVHTHGPFLSAQVIPGNTSPGGIHSGTQQGTASAAHPGHCVLPTKPIVQSEERAPQEGGGCLCLRSGSHSFLDHVGTGLLISLNHRDCTPSATVGESYYLLRTTLFQWGKDQDCPSSHVTTRHHQSQVLADVSEQ
jgi:hypothetical protein